MKFVFFAVILLCTFTVWYFIQLQKKKGKLINLVYLGSFMGMPYLLLVSPVRELGERVVTREDGGDQDGSLKKG